MRKLLAVSLLALLASLTLTRPVAAEQPEPFSMMKVCGVSGLATNECRLMQATGPFAVLNGGVVRYLGPKLGAEKINSYVELETAGGEILLSGHFVWSGKHGNFTLYDGKGALAAIVAQGAIAAAGVEVPEGVPFLLEGIYRAR